jgi:hypothetical protein
MYRFFAPLVLLAGLGLGACADGQAALRAAAEDADIPPAAVPETERPAPAVVDSALPMDEALRRFQAETEGPPPERLTGGEASLDALFRALLAAYAARDAEALDRLAITRAEFAWLYYPESPYPRAPYELSADFLWFLVEERGARGVGKAAERFGGAQVVYRGYECPGAVKEEGGGRLWGPCLVRVTTDGRDDVVRLTNAVLERDGRFKLVGFDNKI